MRGRKPKSGELKLAQGNPGKRPLPEAGAPAVAIADEALPFAQLAGDAALAYTIVGGELKRMNFVKPSDESLLLRYCGLLAEYWALTKTLDKHGFVQVVKTVSGDKMRRARPEFVMRHAIAKLLVPMEDRLGLSPMARQQYMLRMSQAGQQPMLPAIAAAEVADADDEGDDAPPAPRPSSPIGLLKH